MLKLILIAGVFIAVFSAVAAGIVCLVCVGESFWDMFFLAFLLFGGFVVLVQLFVLWLDFISGRF
jgi:hypothetical protein